MKALLLAATSLIAIGGLASAADLPAFEEAPAIVAPVPADLWTGFYVGGQLGFAFNNNDDDGCFSGEFGGGRIFDCDDFEDFDGDGDDDNGGFALGAHVGADWQFGSVVVGGILDLNWLVDGNDDDDDGEFDLDDIVGGPERFATVGFESFQGIDWYGTLRGRVGFAPGAGRFLVYGTGGLAFANGEDGGATNVLFENGREARNFFEDPAIGGLGDITDLEDCERVGGAGSDVRCEFDDDDDSDGARFGWTLGAGAEFLVTDRFSVGAEYLFVNLDEGDDDDNGVDYENGTFLDNDEDRDLDFHTITLKGSFRF